MQLTLVIITVVSALSWLGLKFYKAFFGKETKCEGCAFSKTAVPAKK